VRLIFFGHGADRLRSGERIDPSPILLIDVEGGGIAYRYSRFAAPSAARITSCTGGCTRSSVASPLPGIKASRKTIEAIAPGIASATPEMTQPP
jgi:hypothetical protein